MKSVLLLCLALVPTYSFAAEESEAVVEAVVCKKGKDERRLEVQTRKAGCSLQYVKFGKAEESAKAIRGVELCKSTLLKIRANLEKSGMVCQ